MSEPPPPARQPPDRSIWLAIVGGVLLAFGGVVWLVTWSSARECQSPLITALSPQECTYWTLGHDVGIGVGLLGLVLVIVAIAKH